MDHNFRIFFDTTPVWRDKISSDIFAGSIEDFCDFIKEHSLGSRMHVVLPEVVIKERTNHIVQSVLQRLGTMEERAAELKAVGINIKIPEVKKSVLSKKLEDGGKSFLKQHKIEIAKSHINTEQLLKRALEQKKPFRVSRDEGLKDTLIWDTLIRDAKKHVETHYILLTNNNTDFVETDLREEFNIECGSHRSFRIFPDTSAAKAFFDQELDLELNLKDKHKRVKEIIKSGIPDIIEAINKTPAPTTTPRYGGLSYTIRSAVAYGAAYAGNGEGSEVILGYRLAKDTVSMVGENPQVTEITQSQKDPEKFEVEITVRAESITTHTGSETGRVSTGFFYDDLIATSTRAVWNTNNSSFEYPGQYTANKKNTFFTIRGKVDLKSHTLEILQTFSQI